eukprot:UN34115
MSIVNEAISTFTNKFEHVSNVLGKLYDEYNGKVLERDNLIEKLQKEKEILQEKLDSHEGESEKYKMIETLLKDVNNNKHDDFKRKIKDITSENCILTVNEKRLARKFQFLSHVLNLKKKHVVKLEKDNIEMEQVLKDRICVLENGFTLMRDSYTTLTGELEDSVPKNSS